MEMVSRREIRIGRYIIIVKAVRLPVFKMQITYRACISVNVNRLHAGTTDFEIATIGSDSKKHCIKLAFRLARHFLFETAQLHNKGDINAID